MSKWLPIEWMLQKLMHDALSYRHRLPSNGVNWRNVVRTRPFRHATKHQTFPNRISYLFQIYVLVVRGSQRATLT